MQKKINRIGINKGLKQKDFKLLSSRGFGDGLNTYAHSMAWFKGHLYVATTRGNFPLIKARLPIEMSQWPVECPEDPFELDLRAEIWRFHPLLQQWDRVYKAPYVRGSNGKRIPRDLGYRSMLVLNPKLENLLSEEEHALYISTWSPAKGPGPLILRSYDGKNFTPICEPGLVNLPITTIRTMVYFKGRLFTTPAGTRGGNPNLASHSVIYESRAPDFKDWRPICEYGFGDKGNITIFEMVAFGNYLYVGTLNLNGYQIWRSLMEGKRPYAWERVVTQGAYRGALNQVALSMYPFKGALYVGSAIQGGGVDRKHKVGPAAAELIRVFEDGTWDLIVGEDRRTCVGYKKALSGYMQGFDNFFNGYFWRMCSHDGWLYLSTLDWSVLLNYVSRKNWPQMFINIVNALGKDFFLQNHAGFELFRSFDGENWLPVTKNGMDNPYNFGLRTMESTPYGLFIGTANPFGPKIYNDDKGCYIANPRGGCEVFLADHNSNLQERANLALASVTMEYI